MQGMCLLDTRHCIQVRLDFLIVYVFGSTCGAREGKGGEDGGKGEGKGGEEGEDERVRGEMEGGAEVGKG